MMFYSCMHATLRPLYGALQAANRMLFNQPEDEFLDGDEVVGMGTLGKEGSGRLRMQASHTLAPYCPCENAQSNSCCSARVCRGAAWESDDALIPGSLICSECMPRQHWMLLLLKQSQCPCRPRRRSRRCPPKHRRSLRRGKLMAAASPSMACHPRSPSRPYRCALATGFHCLAAVHAQPC